VGPVGVAPEQSLTLFVPLLVLHSHHVYKIIIALFVLHLSQETLLLPIVPL
jgi:hypothetical protein